MKIKLRTIKKSNSKSNSRLIFVLKFSKVWKLKYYSNFLKNIIKI